MQEDGNTVSLSGYLIIKHNVDGKRDLLRHDSRRVIEQCKYLHVVHRTISSNCFNIKILSGREKVETLSSLLFAQLSR